MKLRLLLALLPLVFVAGCAGLFGGSGGSGGDVEIVNLQPTVYTLPSDGSVTITSIDTEEVVLEGPVPENVAADWTIINNNLPAEQQFVRKVTSVARNGSTVTIQTGEATLADVFNDAEIRRTEEIPQGTLAAMQPGLPGISFETGPAQRSGPQDLSFSHRINFESVEIKGDDNLTILAKISGHLDMTIGFETGLNVGVRGVLDLRPEIKKFRVAPFMTVNGELELTGSVSGSFSKQIPVSLPLSFPIAGLGPVPVNISLQMLLQIEGRVQADGKLKITGGINMSAGIDCTNDVWTTVQTFDPNFRVDPPKIAANANFSLSALKPEVSIGIPGIGDMYVRADVLRANVDIAYRTNPQPSGFVITSSGNFGFSAGGRIKLGPFTALDGELARFDFGSFSLGVPFFLPDTPQLVCYWETLPFLNGQPRRIHVIRPDGTGDRTVLPANSPKDQAQPHLSFDGKKIVYVHNSDIWVVNTDGTNDHMIYDGDETSQPNRPSWAPNNSDIAFDMKVSGVRQIFTLASTGGQPTQVTNASGWSHSPKWNPQGGKIIFSRIAGNDQFIYELDTSNNQESPLVTDPGFWRDPVYNLDGDLVLYWDSSGFWLWNAGSGAGLLADNPGGHNVSFGPDGQSIIYSEGSNTFIANLAGENPRLLTGNGQWASWQFDR